MIMNGYVSMLCCAKYILIAVFALFKWIELGLYEYIIMVNEYRCKAIGKIGCISVIGCILFRLFYATVN